MRRNFVIVAVAVVLSVVTVQSFTGDRTELADAYPYLSIACAQAELHNACHGTGDVDVGAITRWVSYYTNPDGVVYLRFVSGGTTQCSKSWRLTSNYVSDAIYQQWSGSFCDVYRDRFTNF
jgi:hypothetical protein